MLPRTTGVLAGLCVPLLLSALAGCLSSPAPDPLGAPGRDHTAAPLQPTSLAAPGSGEPALQEVAAAEQDSWRFLASAYLWLASKRGVIELDNVGIPLDDPDESSGAFVYLEAEHGRWGLIGDLDFLNSTDATDIVTGTVTVEEDSFIGELDATYRVGEGSTLQVLLGVRWLDSTQDIDRPVLPDVSTDTTQVDPIVGAQGTWPLGERFKFRLRGDVGGFGVDSDLTYQMFGVLAWEFVPHWGLTAGYRMLGWEFESDGVDNDLRLSGMLLGLAASF